MPTNIDIAKNDAHLVTLGGLNTVYENIREICTNLDERIDAIGQLYTFKGDKNTWSAFCTAVSTGTIAQGDAYLVKEGYPEYSKDKDQFPAWASGSPSRMFICHKGYSSVTINPSLDNHGWETYWMPIDLHLNFASSTQYGIVRTGNSNSPTSGTYAVRVDNDHDLEVFIPAPDNSTGYGVIKTNFTPVINEKHQVKVNDSGSAYTDIKIVTSGTAGKIRVTDSKYQPADNSTYVDVDIAGWSNSSTTNSVLVSGEGSSAPAAERGSDSLPIYVSTDVTPAGRVIKEIKKLHLSNDFSDYTEDVLGKFENNKSTPTKSTVEIKGSDVKRVATGAGSPDTAALKVTGGILASGKIQAGTEVVVSNDTANSVKAEFKNTNTTPIANTVEIQGKDVSTDNSVTTAALNVTGGILSSGSIVTNGSSAKFFNNDKSDSLKAEFINDGTNNTRNSSTVKIKGTQVKKVNSSSTYNSAALEVDGGILAYNTTDSVIANFDNRSSNITKNTVEIKGKDVSTDNSVTTAALNVTGGIYASGKIQAGGDISGANLSTAGDISTTNGSITTTNGNISSTSGTVSGNVVSSTTDISAGGDISTSTGTVSGNAVSSTTTVSAGGNISTSGGNISVTGTGKITTASGNIESGGAITASGDISTTNGTVSGNAVSSTTTISAGGDISTSSGDIKNTGTGKITTASGNIESGGAITASGDISTSTGTVSGAAISSTGNISTSGGNISVTGTGKITTASGNIESGGAVTAGGDISTSTGTVSGNAVSSTTTISAGGNISTSGGNISVTGTGTISTASGNIESGGAISATNGISAGGDISTSTGTVSGATVSGGTVSSTGSISATNDIYYGGKLYSNSDSTDSVKAQFTNNGNPSNTWSKATVEIKGAGVNISSDYSQSNAALKVDGGIYASKTIDSTIASFINYGTTSGGTTTKNKSTVEIDGKFVSDIGGGDITAALKVGGGIYASTSGTSSVVAKFANTGNVSNITANTVEIRGKNADASNGTAALKVEGGIYATQTIHSAVSHTVLGNDITDAIAVSDDCDIKPGCCYYFDGNDYLKTDKYCQKGIIGIHSDTASSSLGKRGKGKELDISIGGFVLAYVDDVYKTGTPLTATKGGKLTKMKLIDRILHPERLVATYWKPEMESEWEYGPKTVEVDGRVWVKVK